MECGKPITVQGMLVPCGQCIPCRVNRKRVWSHRIMLESGLQSDNTFITLTYSDESLPMVSSHPFGPSKPLLPSLRKKDGQDWLKRLRKEIEPLKVRYFIVGEYGEMTFRPHLHLALFGYPNCIRGKTRVLTDQNGFQRSCCYHCDLIMRTWGHGHVMLGSLTAESAQYIAGYVTKKMTSSTDLRLNGRQPEYALMSRRPGIGVMAMHDVASTLLEFDLDDTETDVPVSLRHGSRQLPLGRFLRNKLRTFVGKEEGAPESVKEELREKMRDVQARQLDTSLDASRSLHAQIGKDNKQKMRNFEARQKLVKKKGVL